jgi:hypothetical protein
MLQAGQGAIGGGIQGLQAQTSALGGSIDTLKFGLLAAGAAAIAYIAYQSQQDEAG